jgi:hypothetical protein
MQVQKVQTIVRSVPIKQKITLTYEREVQFLDFLCGQIAPGFRVLNMQFMARFKRKMDH